MTRFSKIFIAIIIVILLAWQLPWCYSFFTSKPTYTPFTLYSSLAKDFISIQWEEGSHVFSHDQKGTEYTREQTDSLLPFFYIRQLMADSKVPEEINGIKINSREINITNFNFRSVPSDINNNSAELYPLLESMSGRVELEMPEDVFRMTKDRIEFIVMNTNKINDEKSELFTQTFINRGFKFPAKSISGNPTTRKEYDEGYLIIDNNNELFHLKKRVSRPYVHHIEKPNNIIFKQAFVTEFTCRKYIGFLVDINNDLYVLDKNYKIAKTCVSNFDPKKDELTIIGNMLDWTVIVGHDDCEQYFAINADDYSLIKTMTIKYDNQPIPRLRFTSYKDKFVKPRL